MARLEWDNHAARIYETGVDRGVLYIAGFGVAWNGISAITEAPDGGEAKPLYFDGFKYSNLTAAEDYEATLEAFGYPAEFAQCDGLGLVQNGLFADQQPRKKFGLSYRTLVGNQLEADQFGYKIHLVYGCLSDPSDKGYTSMGSDPTPVKFTWRITAMPQQIPGIRPTAHFVVDSRVANPTTLAALEDLIYGSDGNAPTQPSAVDLVAMFA